MVVVYTKGRICVQIMACFLCTPWCVKQCLVVLLLNKTVKVAGSERAIYLITDGVDNNTFANTGCDNTKYIHKHIGVIERNGGKWNGVKTKAA